MDRVVTRSAEAIVRMCARTAVIQKMQAVNLDLNWTKEYSVSELTSCCERLAANRIEVSLFHKNLQRELIQDPNFASWLSQLQKLIEQEEMDQDEEGPPSPHIRWSVVKDILPELLQKSWDCKCHISSYPHTDMLSMLKQEQLNSNAYLTYLENFTATDVFSNEGIQLVNNLNGCIQVPVFLSEFQKNLLMEPYVSKTFLFREGSFEKVSNLLEAHPELTEIIRLMYQHDVNGCLGLEDYSHFIEDPSEYARLLSIMIQQLGKDAVEELIWYWKKDGCTLSDLRHMELRMRDDESCDWSKVLETHSGYVNFLYGSRFKTLDLVDVPYYQEGVLIYAISHNKKRFIRLVDENYELFHQLPRGSLLFDERFFSRHFNLNALTVNDLADCKWLQGERLLSALDESNREFTFTELKLLHDAPSNYVTLYLKLSAENVDYRIRVLRQLLKRSVLEDVISDTELSALAGGLAQKPLHNWRQEEFGHIQGLTVSDTVKVLIHLDSLAHLLSGIHCRSDAMLALRNIEQLNQFDSMEALKNDLFVKDPGWIDISEEMDLSAEFKLRHRDTIIEFLCKDGVGIVQTYLNRLDSKHKTAFLRVVKAELMGQFDQLKYYDGDLEHELGCPVPPQVIAEWPKNLSISNKGMAVSERDDFFSTMLLGTQPYRTCLSYFDGEYAYCLLACFDSNKKVLYAREDGRIVGRACIRLTKYCLDKQKTQKDFSIFNFVDLEDVVGSRGGKTDDEFVTLFLERPYICGVSPEKQTKIKAMLVELARWKAQELASMLTLSMDYTDVATSKFAQAELSLYISASKAGEQYLDSLGGEAGVSDQGSYESSYFLLEQQAGPQVAESIEQK